MAVRVAGSINVDLIQTVDALPAPGETVLALSSARMPGGKGANQAVAAARMGARTSMIGIVGDDEAGRWMLDQLEADGIDTQHVAVLPDMATGTAYIAVDAAGENQIIVASGANGAFGPQHLPASGAVADVLVSQLEVPVETVAAFFTAEGAEGSTRILNAAPAIREAETLFSLADILIVNQHELAFYLGLPESPENLEEALAARELIGRAGQSVIVTLGAQGALVIDEQSHFHAPAMPVDPVDSIGAGDCFVGVLAAMLDRGGTEGGIRGGMKGAVTIANAAAALCTLGHGAIPAMPTRARVANFHMPHTR